jgi:DNA-binding transcriptional regulator GbsR (MarR family)
MNTIDVLSIQKRIEAVLPTLNEYQRRRYLSAEAKLIGYGGISLISRISGMSRQTLTEGVKELDRIDVMPEGRSRKAGGGRKPVWETQAGILDMLEELVSAHTKGDPMMTLLWTNKSLRNLEKELAEKGYKASYQVVGEMLRMLGYGLQADKKTLTVTESLAVRNAQFEYINRQCKAVHAKGIPVISIDARKKENIGNFRNNGKTCQAQGNPTEVPGHDFSLKELGKLTLFGVYNVFKNQGFVSAGISGDTAVFAVESIRRWWYAQGLEDYGAADEIVVTADCGGGNGDRNRLWKYELQKLANETEKKITVMHYPPGTSKWNKIEHRLFAFISRNWQGIPFTSGALVVSLIGATTTAAGLTATCVLDQSKYETGIKITDEEFDKLNIIKNDFHGEWNYSIAVNS